MKPNLEITLKALDLFGQLDPEEKVEIIKPKVIRNETLDRIVSGYEKGLKNYGLYQGNKLKIKIPREEYSSYYTAKLSAPSEISSNNITEFSLLLEEHENKKYFENFTGWYLSALINGSKDKDFKIFTNYLSKTTDFIGYKNRKNIDVNGSVGRWVGFRMEGGKITINGNAGERVGYAMNGGEITVNGNAEYEVGNEMNGGEITINGNARWGVGWEMKNGKITLNGNAGDWVGGGMERGEITINGNAEWGVGWGMKNGKIHLIGKYKSLSNHIYRGNIYHKDKLIVENGKRL